MNAEIELVSVMVPVYNEENYIENCLNSILHQSYQKIELLIANDCSTDRTLEIVYRWVNKHKERFVRCEIIENEKNLGISKNFNVLIRKATGTYLKSIAGDDMLMPDAIEREIKFLKDNPEADIVYADAFVIDEKAKYPFDEGKEYPLFYGGVPDYGMDLAEALFKKDVIAAPTVMFRKKTFEKYGLYREDLAFEDWEYWLRLATDNGNIGYLNYPVVGYRMLDISGSHYGTGEAEEKRYNKVIDSEEKLLSEYSEFIKDNSMDDYWNRTLKFCIDKGYRNTINNILHTKDFKMQFITKIMLIAYRLYLYRMASKLWMRIKHGK